MRTRFPILIAIALVCGLGAASLPAGADAASYTTQRRVVNVGMLVCNAATRGNFGPENPDPHVFFVADARTDMKPFGLDLANPLAPTSITPDVYNRWRTRQNNDPAFKNGTPEAQRFQIGAKVSKDMGCYWEVNLDNVTVEDLRQYDLLYFHNHMANMKFSPEERDKLIKYIEGGGTLWVEDCGGLSFDPNSPFVIDIQEHHGNNAAATTAIAAVNHPLLSYPFVLSAQEVRGIGDKNVNDYWLFTPYKQTAGNPPTIDNTGGDDALNPPGGQMLVPIVWNTRGIAAPDPFHPAAGWRPYILAGQMGAGKLIFSSGDSGCGINDYVGGGDAGGYGSNSCAISGTNLTAAHPADLKFLYNIAYWTNAHTTVQANPRRIGSSKENIATALVNRWTYPDPRVASLPPPLPPVVGGAAFYKHCVFSVNAEGGHLWLHCFNLKPGQDLDGDGNPDEGIPDQIMGSSYDEIWKLDLSAVDQSNGGMGGLTGASTPTVIEFYDTGYTGRMNNSGLMDFDQRELVVVELSDGLVVAARAFPRIAGPGGRAILAPATRVDWTARIQGAQPFQSARVPSVAWSEGVLFAVANVTGGAGATSGRVVAIDPKNGTSAFHLSQQLNGMTDGNAIPNDINMPPIIGTPTVGAVLNTSTSGTSDKVVYVPCGTGGTVTSGSVRAFWFGTKGEQIWWDSGQQVFRSRSIRPWYVYDWANPGDGNPNLRPRVFWQGHNVELQYVSGANPGINQFTVGFNGTNAIVKIGQLQDPGSQNAIPPNDQGFIANYTVDWPNQISRATWRTVMAVPDITGVGNVPGADAPLLSPDDMVCYVGDNKKGSGANSGRGSLFAVNEQASGRTQLKWSYVMHDGYTFASNNQSVKVPPVLTQKDPNLPGLDKPIRDVYFVGAPAYSNGIIYAAGTAKLDDGSPNGYDASVVCAFKANPEFTISLGTPIAPGAAVRVAQYNPLLMNGANGGMITLSPQQYSVDYDSGTISITSMAPLGSVSTFASPSLPFIVQVAGTPERIIFPHDPGQQFDNLLWYMVVPPALASVQPNVTAVKPTIQNLPVDVLGRLNAVGTVSSSPVIQGDTLWLGFDVIVPNPVNPNQPIHLGPIASFDANPSDLDPNIHEYGWVPVFTTRNTNTGQETMGHMLWATTAGGGPLTAPPVATEDSLAVASANGLMLFEDAKTLIADSNRLVEVNAAGEATWTSEGTRTRGVAGGQLPVYARDPNTGNVVLTNPGLDTGSVTVQMVPFAHPSMVKKLNDNEFLVVDTGNNRVVQIDRGGNVEREFTKLNDPNGLLRPGDPTTLNEPTDCSAWSDVDLSNPANPLTVYHYLIADTGNFRVVEVVDAYDRGGNVAAYHALRFVSSTYSALGKKYRYRSAQRILMRNADLPTDWQDGTQPDPRQLTLTLVENLRLTAPPPVGANTDGLEKESSGGSIVLLNEKGQPLSIVSYLAFGDPTGPLTYRPIVNPTFLSMYDSLDPQGKHTYHYLMCDANGCYQLVVLSAQVMLVERMLGADDYYAMTGKRLHATSIRRLSNDHYLITNKFTGEDNPGGAFGITYNLTNNPANGNIGGPTDFHGEVFELDPALFNWTARLHGYIPDYAVNGNMLAPLAGASIVWRVPSERVPTAGTSVGVIQRFVGDTNRATSTGLLEQPSFADRP